MAKKCRSGGQVATKQKSSILLKPAFAYLPPGRLSLARHVNDLSAMARGWESKSVESQMEDGRRRDEGDWRSAERLELDRKRESLEMSRRNIARDLATARTETHRKALENALRFLDDELGKIGS